MAPTGDEMNQEAVASRRTIANAKRLLKAGSEHEAKELLLEEGYVRRVSPSIHKAYLQLIPPSATLLEMFEEAYRFLDDPDSQKRFKAVTKIARELNRAVPRNGVVWMRDPRASEPLAQAADDADQRVAERALGTLTRLVCQYFPDQRTAAVFRRRVSDMRQETRRDAIGGLACLRREELLAPLVELLDVGTDLDRAEVARQIWGLAYEARHPMALRPMEWSEDGRRFWRGKMASLLRDPYVKVRQHAARALGSLGDRSVVSALEAAQAEERDADTAFYIAEALAALADEHG